jgi:PPOX class probable F420-dependent enzyme
MAQALTVRQDARMKRRDLVRMSDDEVAEYLNGRHTMNVATINHDGSIHVVAMWYGFVDGKPAFWTFGKSQKVLNLERNPQITALVESGEVYEELRGVELVGRAELVPEHDGKMAIGRSVFERYIGDWSDEMVPFLERTGAKRVGVIIQADRVVSWDHRKLEGTY